MEKRKPKKIKEINPIYGVFSTLESLQKQALGGGSANIFRDTHKVFRIEENDWLVDTCIAHDSETWETGIYPPKSEKWVIVQQYENELEAEKGHNEWVKQMREDPNRELEDINVWGL